MLQDSYSSFRIQIAKWLRSMSAVVFWCVMVSSEPRYDMYPPQLTEFWDLENSGRAGECIKYHKAHEWNTQGFCGDCNFYTFGGEGVGHHVIQKIVPYSFFAQRDGKRTFAGEKFSYPYAFAHRKNQSTILIPKLATLVHEQNKRALVLVREPIDAFISAISRFWVQLHKHSLSNELRAMLYGYRRLSLDIKKLPCDRTIFVFYEGLQAFGIEYTPLLSQFLSSKTVPSDSLRIKSHLTKFFARVSNTHYSGQTAISCKVKFAKRSGLLHLFEIHPMFSGKYQKVPRIYRWCNLSKTTTMECLMNVREIVYNVTRELRSFFPELVPKQPYNLCKEELEKPDYGRNIFQRLEIDYGEFMKEVLKPYSEMFKNIWDPQFTEA
eukprot:m.214711 g.214711  ORF g.214711 m.214711 type:complete len:380 (-) comp15871_c0_seq10:993-2132(-)